jgi:hypothetical protein
MRVGITAQIHRPNDTPLDGAFHGWVNPQGNVPEDGDYPFVFDAPGFATYSEFSPPYIAEAQVTAFAHEITFYESPEAFSAAQSNEKIRFASQSFFPSGLFAPDGTTTDSPEAMAIFTGHVVDAAVEENSITGASFYWALIETLGGKYDVVVDRALLPQVPATGGVLSGTFWLSGRLRSFPKRNHTWFGKFFENAR